jgi:putative AdoMet-dependent methyltransferase
MSQTDPFPPSEFDPWAKTYDQDVINQNQFPFDGYTNVLETVINFAAPVRGMSVLDIGTGTGNLAVRFAERGCELWCTDFSEAMLAKAREKLPQAHFALHDFRTPLPKELDQHFDRIVSAYVFHHVELNEKVSLCKKLVTQNLSDNGKLIVADLSFPNLEAMNSFARSVGGLWEQEPYWLVDESIPALQNANLQVEYKQVSACAGIYVISR